MDTNVTEKARADRIARCLYGLAEVLRTKLSKDGIRVWVRILRDIPVDVIEAAGVDLASTSQFMPMPSEMLGACSRIQERAKQKALRARTNIDHLLAQAKPPTEIGPGRAILRLVPTASMSMEAPKVGANARRQEIETQKRAILDETCGA